MTNLIVFVLIVVAVVVVVEAILKPKRILKVTIFCFLLFILISTFKNLCVAVFSVGKMFRYKNVRS